MPNVTGSTLAAPAARVLTPYETSLIRRKAILKAAITRLQELEKDVNRKLYPKIDAELAAQHQEMKATVAVNTVVVEVKHTTQNTPLYQLVCQQLIDPDELNDMLLEQDADGNLKFVTTSARYSAKLVGRNATFGSLLQP